MFAKILNGVLCAAHAEKLEAGRIVAQSSVYEETAFLNGVERSVENESF
jgi:hypothetical protein